MTDYTLMIAATTGVCSYVAGIVTMGVIGRAMPSARATGPSDLSPASGSSQSSVPIAERRCGLCYGDTRGECLSAKVCLYTGRKPA